jgi:hypothetical protein
MADARDSRVVAVGDWLMSQSLRIPTTLNAKVAQLR